MNQRQSPALIPEEEKRLALVRRLGTLLDEQFSIGGFKFGLDPLLNLIPVVGDMTSYFMSIALIITMVRYGASGKLAVKMLLNATLDALVGAIPILGWIFDFTYKANTRNIKLLSDHYTKGKHIGSAKPVIFMILVIGAIILILLLFITVWLLKWITQGIDSAVGITI